MSNSLRDWLRERYPQASVSTLRQMVRAGRVMIDGVQARRFDQALAEGDAVRVLDRRRATAEPTASLHPLRLVHEDADVLVVEKPAGLLTSTGPREKRATALEIVRQWLAAREPSARVGLIHRLDKDASGLLVFSNNEQAFAHLKRQFFEHTVRRVYLAITRRVPNPLRGRIEQRLLERADGTVRPVDVREAEASGSDRGEAAITDYATARQSDGMAAVVVMLHTGRKHQIRAHLLGRAGGVVNDRLYPPKGKAEGRLMLAALVLGFVHPGSGEWMQFELDAPRTFPLVGGAKMSELAAEARIELTKPSPVRGINLGGHGADSSNDSSVSP